MYEERPVILISKHDVKANAITAWLLPEIAVDFCAGVACNFNELCNPITGRCGKTYTSIQSPADVIRLA